MRTMKHWVLAVAAASALALAGCGGGGGSPQSATDGLSLEDRQMTQRGAIESAITMAQTAVAAVNDESTDSDVSDAEMEIADARSAIAAAADVPAAEKTARTGQVDGLERELMAAKKSRTAAISAANEKARIAAQATRNAASMKVAEAINAQDRRTQTARTMVPAEFMPTNADTAANVLTITRGSGAAKITPFQSAADKKTKPFVTGAAQDAGTGWSGMTFTRSGTASKRPFTEMAAVYTDIEQAADALWATQFASAAGGIGTVDTSSGAVALTFVAGTDNEDAERFVGGLLPNAPQSDDDASERTLAAAASVSGMFYGVSGRFVCGSADCIVTRDSKDKVTNTGTITFTPTAYDADVTMAKYATPDADYTSFGYWMESKKQRDDSYNHDIRTFHHGMGGALATLTSLEGSAEYYGAAAGVYVKKDGAGDSLVVTDGDFTADAMLTARFGGDTIAVRDRNKISGTISTFMDGSTNLGFADLKMGAADIDTATTVGSFAGETNGGGTSGNWSGQLYGSPGTDTAEAMRFPINVSGEFTGHFSNGHVAGAFGAEKD